MSGARKRIESWGVSITVLICALTLAGCSVVEVISNLGEPTVAGDEKEAESEAAEGLVTSSGGNARAKLRAYYERERSSTAKEPDPNNPIVRCDAQGKTHFVRKQDCEIRGGRILG